jgi:hypothetical protein
MKGDTTMTTIHGDNAAIVVSAVQSFHCSHQPTNPPSFVMEGWQAREKREEGEDGGGGGAREAHVINEQ